MVEIYTDEVEKRQFVRFVQKGDGVEAQSISSSGTYLGVLFTLTSKGIGIPQYGARALDHLGFEHNEGRLKTFNS